MATRGVSLEVRVYGVHVGELSRDRDGRVRFAPDARWLARRQRPRLGWAFLVDPSPRVAGTGLPTWFDNLLPEAGSPLRRWISKQLGLRETDGPGLLRAVGRDLPGAVEVTGEAEGPLDAPAPAPQGELRFSLAGLQLKLSMVRDGARFTLPARDETGRWIVKIPDEGLADLPEVEQATTSWARAVGLPVPDHHVLEVEALRGIDPALLGTPRRSFAVRRFDRRADGGRVHQEDFAQALEIGAAHKYGDSGPRRVSYDGLSRLVRDMCGEQAQGDFLDRVAFAIASDNGDAHLKNWSLQWDVDGRPRLSPCYDQVCTVAWPASFGWELPRGPALALAFGRSRRFRALDQDALRRFMARANAPDGDARVLAALERARAAWPAVADEAPPGMRDALVSHWRHVPLLRRMGPLAS